MSIWKLHGDGKNIASGEVVAPDERITWPRTIGMGMQHVVAMFGATFLVPVITGFPPSTTLFFSAIGTFTFLIVTGNRLPSYLGSSFAFLAPIAAAKGANGDFGSALFGVLCAGVLLALVGLAVQFLGASWIDKAMPPVVTGTIVMLIGFNLAPAAKNNFMVQPLTAGITVVSILLVTVLFKGMIGRLSILIGVIIGYLAAFAQGQVSFDAVKEAGWLGLPQFQTPTVNFSVVLVFVPVVFALIAENVGHVKSVALMTGKNMDDLTGRALFADGLATIFAGLGGGSGTTTYAENIGVMAATKVYSTAVYWVAAVTALVLSICPKFGALINTIPGGVLGGAGTVLYGMIGLLGARIWIENHVDFGKSANLLTAAVALIAGIADFTFTISQGADPTNTADDIVLGGIAVGSFGAIIFYHVLTGIAKLTGSDGGEVASPASVDVVPVDAEESEV
ncbi:MAG: uracil-xanthine permease family protein [Propionibacteriaceae bacterium]|jgi:uracil-xanthine permease|nr:uracil-xanthine permease family protein [Propionibacteriaceae bacterium]